MKNPHMNAALIICLAMALSGCASKAATGSAAQASKSAVSTASQSMAAAKSSASLEKAEAVKITAEKAKEMMDKGAVTIVDVRTQEEYDAGHIPNAILVPNETIGTDDIPALPDKKAVLLVYCRSGRRSAEASKKLAENGYENVYDFGGIKDWPYDVTGGK